MNEQQLAQLVETNENLVIAVLKAHAQRAEYEKKISDITSLAGTDVLTRLPNRMILLDRLGHAIVNAQRSGDRLAVLFVDLNKFKYINDSLGHAAGDQVLKTAAECMTRSVRASDTVSRHGGDEFVILLEQVSTLSDVTAIIEKIFAGLGVPNRIGHHMIRLTASIGISLYPDDGDDADLLLARADNAMYLAKRSGNAKFVFAGMGNAGSQGSASPLNLLPVEILPGEKELRCAHRRTVDAHMASATLAAQELQAGAEQACVCKPSS